jgi:hypothetical protein
MILKGQRGGRLLVVSVDALARRPPPPRPLTGSMPSTGGTSERSSQVGDDGVEGSLHALVLEARAPQHRRELDLERRLADRLLEALLGISFSSRMSSTSSSS